jgi:hypothetical protein
MEKVNRDTLIEEYVDFLILNNFTRHEYPFIKWLIEHKMVPEVQKRMDEEFVRTSPC